MIKLSNIGGLVLAMAITFPLFNSCQQAGPTNKSYDNVQAMVEDAKAGIKTITVSELKTMQENEEWYTLIDVREEPEHDAGYVPGSVLIPRGLVEFRILNEAFWEEEGMYLPEKTDKIIIYCRSGNRSALATKALQQLGFTEVYSLEGGFNEWKSENPDAVEVNIQSTETPQGPVTTSSDDAGSC